MTFEQPMSKFIDTRINRPEHCRKPDCLMSVFSIPSDKCSPVVDVVNRNVYNRVCNQGYNCNKAGDCVKMQDTQKTDTPNPYRLCNDTKDTRDANCISEMRNCKQVQIKNPLYGEYYNNINICWGSVRK